MAYPFTSEEVAEAEAEIAELERAAEMRALLRDVGRLCLILALVLAGVLMAAHALMPTVQ